MAIFGFVMVVFCWILIASLNQKHRDEHGVDQPTRRQSAYIRRMARKKGMTEGQAYGRWLANKKRRIGQ